MGFVKRNLFWGDFYKEYFLIKMIEQHKTLQNYPRAHHDKPTKASQRARLEETVEGT
jgi:hypothetical protein